MKIFLLLLVILFLQGEVIAQQRCSSAEYRLELFRRSPEMAARAASIEVFTKNLMDRQNRSGDSSVTDNEPKVITIPVVVHVLYHSASQNISDAQVRSQIDILNLDYNRQNADSVNTPAVFRPVAADCGFRFVLAKVDPGGYASTGIIHKFTNILSFDIDDKMKSSASGGDDAWDYNSYLNIWVVNLSSGILGYSSVPGSARERDGVVIQYTAFGNTGTATAPFNRGRTATHEIGHWLNLIHTWGDADCGNDQVDDTPPQHGPTRGCPGGTRISCSNAPNGDMYMNYMDFTDDACMNMFSKGQSERMHTLFAPGGVRYPLLSSTAATAAGLPSATQVDEGIAVLRVYPNPASSTILLQTPDNSDPVSNLEIFNSMGQQVMSLQLHAHVEQVDVSSLKAGLYYIKTFDGKTKNVSKLVKL